MTEFFASDASKATKNSAVELKTKWPVEISSLAVWASFLSALFYLYRWMIEFPSIGLDFMNVWYAARLVLSGKAMALFDLANRHAMQMSVFSQTFLASYLKHIQPHIHKANELIVPDYVWAYPPHFLPWIAGLGLLPYPIALIFWIVITFALYAFAVVYKRPQPWWLLLVLVLAPGNCENIDMGYTGFLIAAFLVGGTRLLDQRPVLAGILLGFLSFKPQFALLVPIALIAGQHWRTLASMTLTTGFLIGLSIFLFGFDPWNSYFNIILPYERQVIEAAVGDEKVKTILMVTPFMAARFIGASLAFAYGIAILFLGSAVVAVVYAYSRVASPDLRNGVLLTAVFLATPYAFAADTTMLSAAIVSMVASRGQRPWSLNSTLLVATAWSLPVFVALFNYIRVPVSPIVIASLLGLQLCWIAQDRRLASLGPEIVIN